MAGRPANPRRPKQIVSAACALFEQRGFHGTTMDDVAESVGLNKGTLYHYFDSKSSLLFQIYVEATDDTLQYVEAVDRSQGPEAALRELITSAFEVGARSHSRTAVYFQEAPFIREWLSDEQVEFVQSREREVTRVVMDIIEEGIAEGVFAKVDPKVLGLGIMGMVGSLHRWYRLSGALSPADVADQFCDVLIAGLRHAGEG